MPNVSHKHKMKNSTEKTANQWNTKQENGTLQKRTAKKKRKEKTRHSNRQNVVM